MVQPPADQPAQKRQRPVLSDRHPAAQSGQGRADRSNAAPKGGTATGALRFENQIGRAVGRTPAQNDGAQKPGRGRRQDRRQQRERSAARDRSDRRGQQNAVQIRRRLDKSNRQPARERADGRRERQRLAETAPPPSRVGGCSPVRSSSRRGCHRPILPFAIMTADESGFDAAMADFFVRIVRFGRMRGRVAAKPFCRRFASRAI